MTGYSALAASGRSRTVRPRRGGAGQRHRNPPVPVEPDPRPRLPRRPERVTHAGDCDRKSCAIARSRQFRTEISDLTGTPRRACTGVAL